jgi:hypothetical protein
MAQRKVSHADVEDITQHYHTTYTDPDGNRNYAGHVVGRRIRVVIVGDGSGPVLVIKTVIAD